MIHTVKENETYTELLYELDQRGNLTAAGKELARLLTLLVEDFKARSYPFPSAKSLEVLQFLLD